MSTTFTSLPAEIQRECISYLDTVTLKSMRLTSHATKDLATETLFEVASIDPSQDSVENFLQLTSNGDFKRCIRKICLRSQRDDDDTYGECHVSPVSAWWTAAFSTESLVPNLKGLILECTLSCANSCCAELKHALEVLLSNADIDSLTVKHLQDYCEVKWPDFEQLHSRPRNLHILLTTWSDDACPDHDIELAPRHTLFNKDLNTYWLAPMQPQLTHLTLHCNTFWGIYPRWQPGTLHFPHLKSLAFGKWTIAFQWQIYFITSHAQTLEQLVLTNCPILHALRMTRRQRDNAWSTHLPGTSRGMPPTFNTFSDLRWHTVLPELQSKLTQLKHFAMSRGPPSNRLWNTRAFSDDEAFADRYKLNPCIDSSRYAVFDFGNGPTEWIDGDSECGMSWLQGKSGFLDSSWLDRETDEVVKRKIDFPDCIEEDREALDNLLGSLRGR